MLYPKLANGSECESIPSLLKKIDCKLNELASDLYNNTVYMLNRPVASASMIALLNYKRIITARYCNDKYADSFTLKMIANRINLLTLGCKNKCNTIALPKKITTTTTTTTVEPTTTTTTTVEPTTTKTTVVPEETTTTTTTTVVPEETTTTTTTVVPEETTTTTTTTTSAPIQFITYYDYISSTPSGDYDGSYLSYYVNDGPERGGITSSDFGTITGTFSGDTIRVIVSPGTHASAQLSVNDVLVATCGPAPDFIDYTTVITQNYRVFKAETPIP